MISPRLGLAGFFGEFGLLKVVKFAAGSVKAWKVELRIVFDVGDAMRPIGLRTDFALRLVFVDR
jgi:hypothetical protein